MKLRMTVRLEIQMKVIQTPMKEQMIQKNDTTSDELDTSALTEDQKNHV